MKNDEVVPRDDDSEQRLTLINTFYPTLTEVMLMDTMLLLEEAEMDIFSPIKDCEIEVLEINLHSTMKGRFCAEERKMFEVVVGA